MEHKTISGEKLEDVATWGIEKEVYDKVSLQFLRIINKGGNMEFYIMK